MKISIITASYNYAQFIEEAINSVISQSYQNWELIIVDDGSCDNSVDIIKSYCEKDDRIKFFQHENGQNKGLKETLLLGIEHASGEWIAFLESDDYFAPDNLSKKIEIIKKYPEVKLVFNKVEFISEKKCRQQKRYENTQKKLSKMKFPKNMFYDFYINNMILTFSCVMAETKTIKNANFNTPTDSILDWWLWIHIAHKNSFYYLDEELTFWRLHDASYIKTSKKPIFYPTQMRAYNDIYQNNGRPFRLLIFMLYSSIILFFVRGYRFFRNIL
ncbi:MAG: glycosyltransferase [bacterium]